jgi:hypothetical protein
MSKRAAKPKREPKRRRLDDWYEMLYDEDDRYGEKFFARSARKTEDFTFKCVACCAQFPRTGVEMTCGHEFWACGSSDCAEIFRYLRSSHRDCLFCYRRFMDKIRTRLGIKSRTPLKTDGHAEADIRAFFASPVLE